MPRKMKTEDQLKVYILKSKKRRKMLITLSALSLLVAVGTFRLLTLPAVTLTDDPNTMESYTASNSTEPASSGDDTTSAEGGDATPSEGDDTTASEGDDTTASEGDNTTPSEGDDTTASEGDDATPSEGDDTTASEGDDATASEGDDATPSEGDDATAAEGDDTGLLDEDQIPEATLPTEYTYDDGNGLIVTAVPEDPASIPEGAEFRTDRVTQENNPDRYAQYQQLLAGESGPLSLTKFTAYDIYFLSDGERVEPDGGTLSVTIVDTTEQAIPPEDAQVFHVLNEDTDPTLQAIPLDDSADSPATAALMASLDVEDASASSVDAADAAQGITFTTDSFSAYLVGISSSLTYKLISREADTFTHTSYYDPSRPLGIAGNFHIVAFDTAVLNAHTNGNVLAKKLKAISNFGTGNLANELSYVQDYVRVNGSSASRNNHVLAIGSDDKPDNQVSTTDGGSHFTINGNKLDSPLNLWQDANTVALPFIDLTAVYNDVTSLSSSLSGLANANINTDATHMGGNNRDSNYIQLTTSEGLGIYNITASHLNEMINNNQPWLGIKGFSGSGGTVIINVDCSGYSNSSISMPNSTSYINGNWLSSSPTTSFTNGRVLWNFGSYSGTIKTSELYGASILAPNATITVGANLNGTIIANTVNVNNETHRDDFVGKLPVSFTVSKTWEGETADTLAKLRVTVELFDENNTSYGQEVLTSGNGWTHNWSNLPSGSHTYTVREIAVILVDGGTETDVTDQYTSSTTYSGSSGTIANTKKPASYTLPETGGPGTYLFTAGGLALMLSAAALLYRRRREAWDS